MGWRERPAAELGVPIPDLTSSTGFVTIVGHGVGPLGVPMFKVKWGAGGEAESWIHAYDTVGCPLALLEYVARDNYERIRLPSGLRIEVCLCQKNTSEREREREREAQSSLSTWCVPST